MKTILVFSTGKSVSGSTYYLLEYLKYIKSKRYCIVLITYYNKEKIELLNQVVDEFIYSRIPFGLSIHEFRSEKKVLIHVTNQLLKFIYGFYFTIRVFFKKKITYVLFEEYTFLPSIVLSFLFGKKYIILFQSLSKKNKFLQSILSFQIRRSQISIFITEDHKSQYSAAVNSAIIYNSSNIETFPRKMNTNKQYIFSFFGGLNPIKGGIEIIQIYEDILDKISPKFELRFYGYSKIERRKNKYDDLFYDYVNTSVHKNIIKFIPFKIDITKDLVESDFVIVNNIVPHFSRPILEAWSNGAIPVANHDKFNSKMIKHFENGVLYTDSESLLNSLLRIISDDTLKVKITLNGWRNYCDKYSQKVQQKKINNALAFL